MLTRLGARPLRETTREDWTRLVAAKRRRAPAMASLLCRTASALLGHAKAHFFGPQTPWQARFVRQWSTARHFHAVARTA